MCDQVINKIRLYGCVLILMLWNNLVQLIHSNIKVLSLLKCRVILENRLTTTVRTLVVTLHLTHKMLAISLSQLLCELIAARHSLIHRLITRSETITALISSLLITIFTCTTSLVVLHLFTIYFLSKLVPEFATI